MRHNIEYYKQFLNTKINKIYIKEIIHIVEKKHGYFFSCICECGETILIKPCKLLKNNQQACKKCTSWKGCGFVNGNMFGDIRRRAKSQGLEFDLTVEYLNDLLIKQNHLCALTGRKIIIETVKSDKIRKTTASLDRIDSSKGYIEGNVQWLYKTINNSKWDFEQNDYIRDCIAVSEYLKKNNPELWEILKKEKD